MAKRTKSEGGMYVRTARDKGLIPAVKRSGQIERRDQ